MNSSMEQEIIIISLRWEFPYTTESDQQWIVDFVSDEMSLIVDVILFF
jgi:hypothetical protein